MTVSNFWAKFMSTPLWVKIAIGIVILVVSLWIYDSFTGGVRDFKNWMFDRQQAKIEQQNQELSTANDKLREENNQLRADAKSNADAAVRAKAMEAIFTEKEKTLDAKQKQELDKVNEALQQQTLEEQQTATPTDQYTQCLRLKDKLIALKLPSGSKLNCEDLRQ